MSAWPSPPHAPQTPRRRHPARNRVRRAQLRAREHRLAALRYGPPYSRELPLYGAKTIAVRDGFVVMRGQPKTPTWTLMAQTADVGATSIRLQGPVNWAVGDVIAIASSSLFANETDSASITSVAYDASTNVTTLGLDQPLNYTHLGITVPVNGDQHGRVLEMRAEVRLASTRNLIARRCRVGVRDRCGGCATGALLP